MKDFKYASSFSQSEDRFYKAVSILIIAILTFLIFYFVSLSWFGESKTGSGVITTGKIAISVTTDLNFNGIFLEPNKTYSKSTTIIGSNEPGNENTNDAYIRVKFETNIKINNQNIIIPIYDSQKWILGEDGWYYYIGIVNKTTSATFNTALQVRSDLSNQHQNQTVIITLTVSAIQREFEAYKNDPDWSTAPTAWKNAIQIYD